MVRLVVINNSPLVKVIGPVTAKVSVSSGVASAMAWRREPGPLSPVVVTTAAHPQGERSIARMAKTNGMNVLMVGLRLSVPRCALKQNRFPLQRGDSPALVLPEMQPAKPCLREPAQKGLKLYLFSNSRAWRMLRPRNLRQTWPSQFPGSVVAGVPPAVEPGILPD